MVNFIRHLTNFRRSVLGCIDSYDSESRRIFQDFSRSTRCAFLCTAPKSEFRQISQFFAIFVIFFKISPFFDSNLVKISRISTNFQFLQNLANSEKLLTNSDEKFVKSSSKVRQILTNKFVSLSFLLTNSEFVAT